MNFRRHHIGRTRHPPKSRFGWSRRSLHHGRDSYERGWPYKVKVSVNRPRRYSDKGRTPLGRYDDEENIKTRELIENSVSHEALEAWELHASSMQGKLIDVLFSKDDGIEERRTFPKKERVMQPDVSEDEEKAPMVNHKIIFADKYKLNRKVILKKAEEVPLIPSSSTPNVETGSLLPERKEKSPVRPSIKVQKEEAYKKLENFINKRKANPDDVLGITKKPASPPRVENTPSSSLLADYGFPNPKKPIVEEETVENVEECVLNKHGHCFGKENCKYAHNGVVNKNKNRYTECRKWEKKDVTVELCPGYLDRKCWNMSCSLRHVLYETDSIDTSA